MRLMAQADKFPDQGHFAWPISAFIAKQYWAEAYPREALLV